MRQGAYRSPPMGFMVAESRRLGGSYSRRDAASWRAAASPDLSHGDLAMPSSIAAGATQRDLLVGGAWRRSATQTPVIYPFTGETVATVANARAADVEDAIAAASDAFTITRRLPAYKRAEILQRAAGLIEAQAEALARQIVLESGNPIGETRGEVARTVTIFQIAAEEAKRIGG